MLTFLITVINNEDDRHCFIEIYYTYRQTMFKVARDFLYDKSYAEDCVQDTFLCLINSFDNFKAVPHEKKRAYIAKICKRCAIHINNSNSMEVPVEDVEGSNRCKDNYNFNDFEKSDIAAVINTLDEIYREPLIMKYMDGMSVEKIALTIGISQNLVMQRLFRARKKLYKLLKED